MKARIHPRERKGVVADSKNSLLNPQDGVPGEERMKVYANGYTARIHETL